jgi:hypothetical protein
MRRLEAGIDGRRQKRAILVRCQTTPTLGLGFQNLPHPHLHEQGEYLQLQVKWLALPLCLHQWSFRKSPLWCVSSLRAFSSPLPLAFVDVAFPKILTVANTREPARARQSALLYRRGVDRESWRVSLSSDHNTISQPTSHSGSERSEGT